MADSAGVSNTVIRHQMNFGSKKAGISQERSPKGGAHLVAIAIPAGLGTILPDFSWEERCNNKRSEHCQPPNGSRIAPPSCRYWRLALTMLVPTSTQGCSTAPGQSSNPQTLRGASYRRSPSLKRSPASPLCTTKPAAAVGPPFRPQFPRPHAVPGRRHRAGGFGPARAAVRRHPLSSGSLDRKSAGQSPGQCANGHVQADPIRGAPALHRPAVAECSQPAWAHRRSRWPSATANKKSPISEETGLV